MNTYTLIDLLRGTSVVKEYKAIRKDLTAGYDFLANQRKEKLSNLLLNCRKHPFYKDCLSGYDDSSLLKDPFIILKKLPYTSKLQIGANPQWFFDNDPGQTYEKRFTGGSTGTPFNYYLSKYSISRITAFNYFLWSHFLGYKIGDKILSLGGDALGKKPGMKIKLYNRLQQKYFVPGDIIDESVIQEGLDLLFNAPYQIIYAYTYSLDFFIDQALKRNLVFKRKIKGVVTVSEMLTEKTCAKIKSFFNCEVLNCYGARDGGIMGGELQCQDRGFYFNFFDCIAESMVLDEKTGKPELVLTNLGNYSFPFIRYRVGDIGQIQEYDGKTRLPLPKITNLEGRSRDLVYTPSGGVVHGSAFNAILKSAPGIDNYQIVQHADFNLEVRIKSSTSEVPQDAIIQLIRSLLNDSGIQIQIMINQDFVQQRNQKHKIIVSYVTTSQNPN